MACMVSNESKFQVDHHSSECNFSRLHIKQIIIALTAFHPCRNHQCAKKHHTQTKQLIAMPALFRNEFTNHWPVLYGMNAPITKIFWKLESSYTIPTLI